ncbi:hypothetical protein [Paraburkholderia tropica]|uniref:hypothetical protein n=1 Tax=Paraburkholderia tropica TaxID=92647 RepID=UPI002AB72498|nr:hypothetical protein [Paraburkholderia tropica]
MKADLARLPQAAKVYIHELEAGLAERDARIDELTRRLDALEEQYRLALARQYGKHLSSTVAQAVDDGAEECYRMGSTRAEDGSAGATFHGSRSSMQLAG